MENAETSVATIGKPALPTFNLTPKTLDEAMKLAELIANSDLAPKDFKGKPGNVLIAVQMGAEVGLAPMQALQNIAVINGRPSIWGDAVLAIVQGSGLLEFIEETDDGEEAKCRVKRKGVPVVIERCFSMKDASTAGLAGGNVWKGYPKRMRQMRARAYALRDGFADVLRGLNVREEIEDYAVERATNITPERPESLMPQSRSETAGAGSTTAAGKAEPEVQREPGSDDRLRFEIKGRVYETNGITKEQLLETFRLAPLVDAAKGKNAAAKLLLENFKGVETRLDLGEEQAVEYIAILREAAGEKSAAA